ncbi:MULTISPECIES: helix-turn-helix transcriptional regulator [Streptomyces]|uniref:HTH cro/C1-type domain-containing protein n=1 Tax=Streptomyces bottropensis ATCC 25435 TaxID=1054862 RepID=M3FW30_9ACTN|nr:MULTISPECIES: helix-turn-helix transcriptional regulator [Streptomyces]EMF56434.1 hypothetical protein SBD_2185 [Streptomyces bottropensis ATCC 25435]MZD16907.1 helix-turn-helix domain-containing protein [Streptomyces sp. SID5476]
MTRSAADGAPQRPYAHLAEHLAELRRAARLPQRTLAEAANISRGAVQRAESGTAAPTEAVLDAYLHACRAGEADRARARLLRTRGRTAQRDKLHELKAPAPEFITTKRDLALALAELYERAGAPSLNDARVRKLLPRTTAWRIVNRKGLPASAEQLITFLSACGISRPAAQRPYIDAYHHVITQRGTRPAPPRTQRIDGRIYRTPLAYSGGIYTEMSSELAATTADLARLFPARVLEEAFTTTLQHHAGRDAHRNGATPPRWITTSHNLDRLTARAPDHADDLVVRSSDGSTARYQVKLHLRRLGPPPALSGVRAPTPPPRPAPASRAS